MVNCRTAMLVARIESQGKQGLRAIVARERRRFSNRVQGMILDDGHDPVLADVLDPTGA